MLTILFCADEMLYGQSWTDSTLLSCSVTIEKSLNAWLGKQPRPEHQADCRRTHLPSAKYNNACMKWDHSH